MALETLRKRLTAQGIPTLFTERQRLATVTALVIIVSLAAAVRVVNLADNPPGFFADEAAIGFNAYSILTTGRDEYGELLPVFFRSFGEYKFPVFIYGAIPFISALGLTEQAVRLAAAALGTLTVLSVFFLARTLFNEKTALATAFLLAVTPWHIHYSRIGFELISFPLVLTTGLFLLLTGLRHPRVLPYAAVVMGLTFYTYGAAWLIVPLLLGMFAILYRKELLALPRTSFISLALFLGVLVPVFIHLVSGSGQARWEQTSIFTLELTSWETVARFFQFYGSYFSPDFLFRYGDNSFLTRHYLPGFGQLYWFQLPLLLLGVGALLWRRSKEGVLVLWLLLIYPLSGALTNMSPISSRTILGSVVLALVAGYGTAQLASGYRFLRRHQATRVAIPLAVWGAVLILGVWSMSTYLRQYHQDYPTLSADFWGWQYGPGEIVPYFVEVEDQYDDLVMDGEFNAPWIFLKFYAPDRCTKCRIGDLSLHVPGTRQLFALKPSHLTSGLTYVTRRTVNYPNGEVAFLLVEVR